MSIWRIHKQNLWIQQRIILTIFLSE